jgi:hypothetical protein
MMVYRVLQSTPPVLRAAFQLPLDISRILVASLFKAGTLSSKTIGKSGERQAKVTFTDFHPAVVLLLVVRWRKLRRRLDFAASQGHES